MDEDELCVEIKKIHFYTFLTQLNKQGNEIIAVNDHFEHHAYVWIRNSPLLQTQLIPTANQGMTCSGFDVMIHPNKPKGKLLKELKNASYFDVLRFCDNSQPKPTSWSPPTNLGTSKFVYRG